MVALTPNHQPQHREGERGREIAQLTNRAQAKREESRSHWNSNGDCLRVQKVLKRIGVNSSVTIFNANQRTKHWLTHKARNANKHKSKQCCCVQRSLQMFEEILSPRNRVGGISAQAQNPQVQVRIRTEDGNAKKHKSQQRLLVAAKIKKEVEGILDPKRVCE